MTENEYIKLAVVLLCFVWVNWDFIFRRKEFWEAVVDVDSGTQCDGGSPTINNSQTIGGSVPSPVEDENERHGGIAAKAALLAAAVGATVNNFLKSFWRNCEFNP